MCCAPRDPPQCCPAVSRVHPRQIGAGMSWRRGARSGRLAIGEDVGGGEDARRLEETALAAQRMKRELIAPTTERC